MAPTFSLVINAGGQSRRMGQDKALLRLPISGQPLLRHMVDRLGHLPLDQIVIVANNPHLPSGAPLGRPVIYLADAYPQVGALGGIATGLAACADWAICVACDMPLIKPTVLHYLCTLVTEQSLPASEFWQAIVPRVDGYAQPLHALYHRSALPVIERALAAGERRAAGFLADIRVRWVEAEELRRLDPNLHSFFNANTPAEWAEALHLLALEG